VREAITVMTNLFSASIGLLMLTAPLSAVAQVNVPSGDSLARVERYSSGPAAFNDRLGSVRLGIRAGTTLPGTDVEVPLWEGGASGRNIFTIERRLEPCSASSPVACVRHSAEVEVPLWQRGNNLTVVRFVRSGGSATDSRTFVRSVNPTFTRTNSLLPSPPPPVVTGPPSEVAIFTNPASTTESFSANRVAKFSLPVIPRRVQDAPLGCVDFDRDGLNDLWESEITELLRPTLVLEGTEDLRSHPEHQVASLISVLSTVRNMIVISYSITFGKDYGWNVPPFSFGPHSGDTQQYATMWKVEFDGSLRWFRSFYQAHRDGLPPKLLSEFSPRQTFNDETRPLIWVEEDKHGLWSSYSRCDDISAYPCGAGWTLEDPFAAPGMFRTPPAFNVGDITSMTGARPLIDDLDLHPALAALFPNEMAFGVTPGATSPRPNTFCGGLGASDCEGGPPLPGGTLNSVTSAIQSGFDTIVQLPADAPQLRLTHNTTPAINDVATATLVAALF
jgi:hypothetical protein